MLFHDSLGCLWFVWTSSVFCFGPVDLWKGEFIRRGKMSSEKMLFWKNRAKFAYDCEIRCWQDGWENSPRASGECTQEPAEKNDLSDYSLSGEYWGRSQTWIQNVKLDLPTISVNGSVLSTFSCRRARLNILRGAGIKISATTGIIMPDNEAQWIDLPIRGDQLAWKHVTLYD